MCYKGLANAEILEKNIMIKENVYFNFLNFSENIEEFIQTFKKLQLENIFKDKYVDAMISKIQDLNSFGIIIMEYIGVNKINKINSFFIQLNEKYEKIVKIQIESFKYIKNKMDKIGKKISSLIYHELDDEYKSLK